MKASLLLAPLLLTACGAGRDKAMTDFKLSSTAFEEGRAIPPDYGCDGADRPPPLSWSEPPEGTQSFALVVDDPDAPGGTFRHWGAYNIPAAARSLTAGAVSEVRNDFGKRGYGGPCPPRGHGPHRYRFKLFALSVDKLALPAGSKVAELEQAAERQALGRAEIVGTYERS